MRTEGQIDLGAWLSASQRGRTDLMQRIFSGAAEAFGMRSRLREGGWSAEGAGAWVCHSLQRSQTQEVLWAGMQFNAGCSPLSRTTGQSPPHSQGKINSLSEGQWNIPFRLQLILFLSGPWSSCWPLSGRDFTSETPLPVPPYRAH